MISTTVDGTNVFLLTADPNLGDAVKIGVSRLTERHSGKTRREERRALGATLRWRLEYNSLIDTVAAAQAFRLALKAFANEPILCPAWFASKPYGESLLFTGGLRCTWEPGWTSWELHTGSSPAGFTPSDEARTAPVLWGRFRTMPDPDLFTTELPKVSISFVETGPATYAIAPAAGVTPHNGPTLHGQPWPLLDFTLDYDKTRAGGVEVVIDRQRLGFGRDEVETFYPHAARRPVKYATIGDAAEAARLIATFHACGGTVLPLWFPSAASPTHLAAATSSGSASIDVESAAALGGHPHIIFRALGGIDVARKVQSIDGNTLTLDSSPGDFAPEEVSLQLLLFGRFLSDDLELSWAPDDIVRADFSVTELPTDYSAPAGEIYGETLGNVGAPIFTLEATDPIGSVWRWTNFESEVEIEGNTYEPRRFQWERITQRLNLDDAPVQLSVDSWVGNPFMRLAVPRRGQQLTIVLKEWDAGGATPAVQLLRGVAMSASVRGRVIKVPIIGEGTRLFDMRVPRRTDGITCPWLIYGIGCNLDPEAKKVSQTIAQVAPAKFNIYTGAPREAGYFAGGWARRANPGDGSSTYGILQSSESAGPSHTVEITLDMPISPSPGAGEVWTIYPGCDGKRETCAMHGNLANFGGQWRKPASNPVFTPVKQSTAPTSKK